MKEIESLDINLCIYGQLIFENSPKIHNGEKIVFFIKVAEKTIWAHAKE